MVVKYWKTILTILSFAIIIAVTLSVWSNKQSTAKLTLNFNATVDAKPLVFNQIIYPNPGGAGKFKIRDFQFYISNIKLISQTGDFVEQESYHLARFDNKDIGYTIQLNNIPNEEYQTIEFSIGVDKIANSSIAVSGDLDPNSRMAWSWDVGYKFILFEGGILNDELLRPLVYHVGFNENYKTLSFPLEQPLFTKQKGTLRFNVDIMKLFNGAKSFDMIELPSVKFDRKDAKMLSNNYSKMIEMVR